MSDARFTLIVGSVLGAIILIGYVVLAAMEIDNAELITGAGGLVLGSLGLAAVKAKGDGKKTSAIVLALLPVLALTGCHQSPSQRYRTIRQAHITTTRAIVRISQINPDLISLRTLKRYELVNDELKAALDTVNDTLQAGGDVSQATLDHIQRRLDELNRIHSQVERKVKEGTNDDTAKHHDRNTDRSSSGRSSRSNWNIDQERTRRRTRPDHRRTPGATGRRRSDSREFESRDSQTRGAGQGGGGEGRIAAT